MDNASLEEFKANHPIGDIAEPDLMMLFLMGGIWEKTRRRADRYLKKYGITFPQYLTIASLCREEGVTQRELAQALDFDATSVTVICDGLEKRNMLQRRPDPSDRRVNRLFLTDEGKDSFRKVSVQIQDGQRRVFANLQTDRTPEMLDVFWGLYKEASNLLESDSV
jgi:MarR family transcriptional regulator for hemolysin